MQLLFANLISKEFVSFQFAGKNRCFGVEWTIEIIIIEFQLMLFEILDGQSGSSTYVAATLRSIHKPLSPLLTTYSLLVDICEGIPLLKYLRENQLTFPVATPYPNLNR